MTLIGVQDKEDNVQRFLVNKTMPITKLKDACCMMTDRIVRNTWLSTHGSSEVKSLVWLEEGDIIYVHGIPAGACGGQSRGSKDTMD